LKPALGKFLLRPVRAGVHALTLAAVTGWPLVVRAQTLNISSGVQKYFALTNATVTMTGHCELWVADSQTPLSGCTINLNSTDAWLFLPNVPPSVVVSNYLTQVRVNGANAVADGNVRVVEYAMGAVVIPEPPGFQPMQVFDGAQFTGPSLQLSQYTLYTGAALGALDRAISSFLLKRGYMAVVAQNVDGTGASRCYIAQDGDLDVSVLPAALDNQIRFIRVTPWRWTSKKGIAGDPGNSLLNVGWWYDWNIDQSSSRDLEYVAIRQNQYWPGLGQNWQSLGVNTVLGYNEPDNTSQANMSVATAITSWPDLLGTGLRVGSPAVTDGGRSSWLYPFIQQADADGLRVDFIAVHYYWAWNPADPSGVANQMYNFLLDIWNHTHRPIWVTEWNNGANWTDNNPYPPPTFAQQQACIAAMVHMLNTTPFVERYALYNWVEDVRSVVTNGVLTGAGVAYRDEVSPVSYLQTTPDVGSPGIAQFLFETNTLDTSGYGNHGFAFGCPAYTPGRLGQANVLDGTNNFIQLPTTMGNATNFSFAAWVYWNGGADWQRLFDFGNDTSHYLFLTPSSGSGTLRFAINNGGGEQIVEADGLPSNQWEHVALTLNNGAATLYTNGQVAASSGSITIIPANFNPTLNYLGKSQFSADPLFHGKLDDVQIANYAFAPIQVASLMTDLPPQFATSLIDRGTAAPLVQFGGTVSGTATDPDPGDTLTYSKANGPTWLTINADGTFTGAPGSSDGGTNYFTVRATDAAGASAFAVMMIYVPISYGNGTWNADASGDWNDATEWSGGAVANGAAYTADFSTVNITADRTVMLDQPRSIGTLKFGDPSGAQDWTLGSYGDALTLDSGSSAVPSIVVAQNTATIATLLAGTSGFAKSGAGTLVLSNANSLFGTVYIDTSSTGSNEGNVRAAYPGAFGSVTNIQIRDNNSGSSTFQLDGSAGNVTMPASFSINCRNNNVPTIQNLAGTNTLTGSIALNVGGNLFNIESDAGQLVIAGTNQYTGSLAGGRNYNFSGAGDVLVSGPILGSANGAPIGVIKAGTGTLTLAGANTYANTTAVNGGTLLINGSTSTGAVVVANSATLGGQGLIKGPITIQAGGMLAPGADAFSVGTLRASNSVTLQPGGLTRMKIGKTPLENDMLLVIGRYNTLTYGGTLVVTNVGGTLAAGDSFRLFYAINISGFFIATNLPVLFTNLAWDTSSLSSGTLTVVSTASTVPTNLDWRVSGTNLVFTWPGDHIGWRLLVQTNHLAAGVSMDTNDWITIPDSQLTNEIMQPVDPSKGIGFYRLIYP
jgi:autotransporter-associated beta strand protein